MWEKGNETSKIYVNSVYFLYKLFCECVCDCVLFFVNHLLFTKMCLTKIEAKKKERKKKHDNKSNWIGECELYLYIYNYIQINTLSSTI